MNTTGESAFLPSKKRSLPRQAHVKKSQEVRATAQVLAERLRAVRLAAHLTQQEVAGERFSKSYISALERGKVVPSFQSLAALGRALAVPLSYLLGERDLEEGLREERGRAVDTAPGQDSQADEEEARRWLGQAETCIRQDRAEEAWEHLGGQDEPPAGWPIQLCPHWAWLAGWALFLLGRPAEAVRCLEQGLALAGALRQRAPRGRQPYWDELIEWLHCFLGVNHCALGETTRALEYYQRGLEAIEGYQRAGNAELKLWIYKGLANEYLARAQYHKAIGYYEKALGEVENCDNKRQHGLAAWGLAATYQQQGDLFRARIYYQNALQAFGEYGNPRLLARIRALYGLSLIDLEDYDEAERQLQKSLAGAERIGHAGVRGEALAYLASLQNARGHPDQAIETALASLQLAQQGGYGRAQGHALFVLVDAYSARQNWAEAEQAYRDAIRLAKELPDAEMRSQAYQGYADFLARQGRFQEAYRVLALGGDGTGVLA